MDDQSHAGPDAGDQHDGPADDRDAARDRARAREAEAVRRIRGGDQAAFAGLYDDWFDRVYDLVSRIVRDREVAAEVAQDTFLVAWQKLDTLEQPEAFGGWLLRIARNRALNRYEREQRAVAVDDDVLAGLDRSGGSVSAPDGFGADVRLRRADDPATAAEDGEIAALLWSAAGALGERDATVLDLQLRHGLSPAEIGEVVGVNRNAANQLVHRVKGRLEAAVRARVIWSDEGPACAMLRDELAGAGVEQFDERAVKLIERHVARCDECGERQRLRVSPTVLFGALPIMAAPVAVRAEVAAALAGQGVPVGEPGSAAAGSADGGSGDAAESLGGEPGSADGGSAGSPSGEPGSVGGGSAESPSGEPGSVGGGSAESPSGDAAESEGDAVPEQAVAEPEPGVDRSAGARRRVAAAVAVTVALLLALVAVAVLAGEDEGPDESEEVSAEAPASSVPDSTVPTTVLAAPPTAPATVGAVVPEGVTTTTAPEASAPPDPGGAPAPQPGGSVVEPTPPATDGGGGPAPVPVTSDLTVTPDSVPGTFLAAADLPMLSWSVNGAASVSVSGPGVTASETSGSRRVCPGMTISGGCLAQFGTYTWTLVAYDAGGSLVAWRTATLTV